MIANYAAMDIRPGSMGRPLPGVEAARAGARRGRPGGRDGEASRSSDRRGRRAGPAPGLAVDVPRLPARGGALRACFAGGWYLTGDLARRDADGYFWFVGRGRRRHQVRRPPDRPLRGRERADGAPRGRRGRRDRHARSGGRRGGQGVRRARSQATTPSEELRWSCSASPRARLGAAVAPAGDRLRPAPAAARAAARSCAGCSRPASSACPRATCPPSRAATSRSRRHRGAPTSGAAERRRARRLGSCCADAPHPALRGDAAPSSTAPPRSAASCTSTSARRPSRPACCSALAPDDAVVVDLPRARPRAGRAACRRARSWPRCSASSRAAAAAAAARCTCSTPPRRFYGGNAIVGGGLPLAVGLALADKMRGRARVTACFFGDGAVAEGEFHESLNLAALWQLPVLFCCENNLYAMGTALRRAESRDRPRAARRGATRCPRGRSTAWTSIAVATRPRAPRRPSATAAGPASWSCAPTASARTRCSTPSSTATRPRSRGWQRARPDPDARAPRLRDAGELDDAGLARAGGRGRRRDRRGRRVRRGRHPRAGRGPHPLRHRRGRERGHVVTAAVAPGARPTIDLPRGHAGRRSARRCARDQRVFLMGEDVGRYGGCFAVSLGLLEEFGPSGSATRRCRSRRSSAPASARPGRHAADRRDHDRQLQPARARPDPEQRRHAAAHVRRPVQRAAGDPHDHGRRPAARRAALAQPGGLVRAHPRAEDPRARDARGRPRHARGRRSRIPTRC